MLKKCNRQDLAIGCLWRVMERGSGLDRLPGSWGRKAGDGALAKRNNMGVDWEHNEVC